MCDDGRIGVDNPKICEDDALAMQSASPLRTGIRIELQKRLLIPRRQSPLHKIICRQFSQVVLHVTKRDDEDSTHSDRRRL